MPGTLHKPSMRMACMCAQSIHMCASTSSHWRPQVSSIAPQAAPCITHSCAQPLTMPATAQTLITAAQGMHDDLCCVLVCPGRHPCATCTSSYITSQSTACYPVAPTNELRCTLQCSPLSPYTVKPKNPASPPCPTCCGICLSSCPPLAI